MTIKEIDTKIKSQPNAQSIVPKPLSTDAKSYGYQKVDGAPIPPPIEKPPFTLKQIRDAIPPHCFERFLLQSRSYLISDLTLCLSIFYLSTLIYNLPPTLRTIIWPIYWVAQGVSVGGPWVLAHECGHHAFSPYKWVNHVIGFILHSFLLVPYFNWRESHRKHHMNTASMEHDETHIPPTRSNASSWLTNKIQENVLYNLTCLILMWLIGWIPFYLFYNMTGPSKYHGKNASHFSTKSAIYKPSQWKMVVVSDVGIFMVLVGLTYLIMKFGLAAVIFHYFIPFMVLYTYFVTVVLLHHTDTYIPHYRGSEWSWLRGTLCTVDRSYGKIFDTVTHEITTTHVVHHLFPQMPFYHAKEATQYMSKVIGKYHLKDETPVLKALWRTFSNCHFVEDDDMMVFWKRNFRQ